MHFRNVLKWLLQVQVSLLTPASSPPPAFVVLTVLIQTGIHAHTFLHTGIPAYTNREVGEKGGGRREVGREGRGWSVGKGEKWGWVVRGERGGRVVREGEGCECVWARVCRVGGRETAYQQTHPALQCTLEELL